MGYVPLSICLRWPHCRQEGCPQGAFEWLQKRARDLQDGKLAGSDNEDGGEHEPNAGSKQCQGCD
jgi:hypothetical protein